MKKKKGCVQKDAGNGKNLIVGNFKKDQYYQGSNLNMGNDSIKEQEKIYNKPLPPPGKFIPGIPKIPCAKPSKSSKIVKQEQIQYPPPLPIINYLNTEQKNQEEKLQDNEGINQNMILEYKIIKELGNGATASVHLVTKGNEAFALKRYKITEGQENENTEKRKACYQKEIDIVKKINHINIVKYYVAHPNQHLIIMEYIEGGSLYSYVKKYDSDFQSKGIPFSPLKEQFIKEILFQVAMTLKYIHGKHILHRDIKLDNLLIKHINNRIIIKLCDFGCSKCISYNISPIQTFTGTFTYMAPEMFDEKFEAHYTIDTWSLGVLIYYLCTRNYPYESNGEQKHLIQQSQEQILKKVKLPNVYSDDLNEIVSGMFLKNKDERSNASHIINSKYFTNLKNKIIYEKYYIIEPYLVCLYEFENFEIYTSLEHIEACINIFVKENNFKILGKFFLLKMKVLLFCNLLAELSTFVKQDLDQRFSPILKELLSNDNNFFFSYHSLLIQWKFLINSEPLEHRISILNEKIKQGNLNLDNDTLYTYCESLGIVESKYNIGNAINTLKDAIRIYSGGNDPKYINVTFEYSRMNYYLGSLYSKASNYDDGLKCFNESLKFYQLKDKKLIIDDFLIKILINTLNLLFYNRQNGSLQNKLPLYLDYCFWKFTKTSIPRFSQVFSSKLFFKFISILMNGFLRNNPERANQIMVTFKNFFDNIDNPFQMNQVAYYYYLLNDLEESLRFMDKAFKILNNVNITDIDYLGMICNKSMLLFLLGLHDECKNLLYQIRIDFSQEANNPIKQTEILNLCFLYGFYNEPDFIIHVQKNIELILNVKDIYTNFNFYYDLVINLIKQKKFNEAYENIAKLDQCYNNLLSQNANNCCNFQAFLLLAKFYLLIYQQDLNFEKHIDDILKYLTISQVMFPKYDLATLRYDVVIGKFICMKFKESYEILEELLQFIEGFPIDSKFRNQIRSLKQLIETLLD